VNDADTGLVYMQQRYYDPIAGRFLSVDPITTDANTGSGFNIYEYAGSNPYRYTDPDGREPGDTVIKTDVTGSHIKQTTTISSSGGVTTSGPLGTGMAAMKAAVGNYVSGQWGSIKDAIRNDGVGGTIGRALSGIPGEAAVLGAVGKLGKVEEAAKAVTTAETAFKTAHYASRLEAAGVNVAHAEAAVLKEVNAMRGSMATNADTVGRIAVGGVEVEYRARLLPNGTVNVGTLFPVK
jgi:RHS repeat-associated protein